MQKSKTSSRREDGTEDIAQQVKILVATLDKPHYGRKSTPANCPLTSMCAMAHVYPYTVNRQM